MSPESSEESQDEMKWGVGIVLESLSLCLEEPGLLRAGPLQEILPLDFGVFEEPEIPRDQSLFSPRLWNLPEVFRRKLTAYSEHYFHEVNTLNRITQILRYNFSDKTQISSKDILRHPYYRKVPVELLPDPKPQVPHFAKWPLLPHNDRNFISRSITEVEEIIQALLANAAEAHRQGKLPVYLQSGGPHPKALKLQAIEFDAAQELDWRVIFEEKHQGRNELLTEFKLVSHHREELRFFQTYAVGTQSATLIVHPWLRELSFLQEVLSDLSPHLALAERKMPQVEVRGELETKTLLRALRGRHIPVRIEGESRTLPPEKSKTQIHLDDTGAFFVRHEARVTGQKNLVRNGWTSKTSVFLETLSRGLPLLLNTEPKTLASRSATRREWDLKILKHLGILHYLFTETLSLAFEKRLTDGREVRPDELFAAVQEHVQKLLIIGSGGVFVRDVPLHELCSKPVLKCFEDFVAMTFKALANAESFYSEAGEVILEGVVEREFRLLFELLLKAAAQSAGEIFKKPRASVFSVLPNSGPPERTALANKPAESSSLLMETIESMQGLIPFGFQIFYKDQVLQELGEDEFHVDFLLQSDPERERDFNWFELNPRFFLRGEEVDASQLLNLGKGGVIEFQGRLYLVPQKQLPTLRRLELFWEKLQRGKTPRTKKNLADKIYQLPHSSTLELLALRASGVTIRGDAEWKRLCDFYDGLGDSNRPLNLPSSLEGVLKPYQEAGVRWLQDLFELRLGALLADDMGLGKTLQTLSFLEDLRAKNNLGQVLVVVPSSLIFNWEQEIEKFTPSMPHVVFSNKDRERVAWKLEGKEDVVVIATYGLLMEHHDFFNQYKWKVAIFDEAQNLKTITTKRTSVARSLTAQFKICLTGTPMENHYGEFYSLVDLLVPGSLGRIEDFRRQFVNTEMITREQMDDLKLKIKPLLLRRTKKEILDQLPEKQETKVSIAFEERQKEIYRDIALAYNQRVQESMAIHGEASVQLQMLTALLRLRQACSDPGALPNVKYDRVPPKLETLLESITEIIESGESALIFTQFLRTLEHTASLLKKAGIPVFILHGGTPTKQRQKVLSDFHAQPNGAVLLMTLKTGGVGLNLTKASYVFHLEPWWNPSVENQATDRAHRMGQSKRVQVFRYIMHESLEEKIELLKTRKDRKFQTLFAQTEGEIGLETGGNALSKQDFDLLLGLK